MCKLCGPPRLCVCVCHPVFLLAALSFSFSPKKEVSQAVQCLTNRTPVSVLSQWFRKWGPAMDRELAEFTSSLVTSCVGDVKGRVYGNGVRVDNAGLLLPLEEQKASSRPPPMSLWDLSYNAFPMPPAGVCPAIAASGVTLREIRGRFMLYKHLNQLLSSPHILRLCIVKWKSIDPSSRANGG